MTAPFEFALPPEPEHLRALRRWMRHKLARVGVDADQVDSAILVVDEMISNAIEHGAVYRRLFEPLVVRMELAGADLLIEFDDPEVPPEVAAQIRRTLSGAKLERPPIDSERGRGMFLVADALRDIQVDGLADGGLRIRGRLPGTCA